MLLGEHAAGFEAPFLFHVGMVNVAAARLAVNHLAAQGRRRIAAIGRQATGSMASSLLRTQGYREGLAGAGLSPEAAQPA